jgi:hypothetical protein
VVLCSGAFWALGASSARTGKLALKTAAIRITRGVGRMGFTFRLEQ